MNKTIAFYGKTVNWLNMAAIIIPPLLLRLIMAYEFGESGYEKYIGTNWFTELVFPFPFNLLSDQASWLMATWIELIGAAMLVLGLATRFFSLSLIMLTIVAIASVHWPDQWSNLGDLWQGYAIEDDGHGNFKLPLLFILMLTPLLFSGAGKFSLDYLIARRCGNCKN